MMTIALTSDATISRNADIVFTDMEGEIVMMSIEQGEYYGMDKIATKIWEMLEAPLRIDALCKHLCEQYEVDFETCLNDTLPMLQMMVDQQLIDIQ